MSSEKVSFNTKVILCSSGYVVLRRYKSNLKKNSLGCSNTREDKAFNAVAVADARGAYSPLNASELDDFFNENYEVVSAGDDVNDFFAVDTLEKITPLEIKDVAKNKVLNSIYNSIKVSKPKKKNAVKRRDSLIRTRNEIFYYVMENASDFKTFITLTFAGNPSPEICYKKFRNYITHLKRLYPGFKYIGVPEFQKRGVLHFHILTNLEVDKDIEKRPSKWIKIICKDGSKKYKVIDYYDVLGWSVDSGRGFSLAEPLKDKNDAFRTSLYLVKYITKDLKDVDALRGHRLILKSQNLNPYKVLYFNDEKNEVSSYFDSCDLQNYYSYTPSESDSDYVVGFDSYEFLTDETVISDFYDTYSEKSL